MDNTDMYWDDICWNDVVSDWDENGELPNDEDELKTTIYSIERKKYYE